MSAPIKCWMKTVDGEEGEVILDPRFSTYLEFGSFSHGSGMSWPQEEPESEDDDGWDEDEGDDTPEESVFLSVIFHDEGGVTADGVEVVEHRGVPDWAFNGGLPNGGEA